MMIQWLHTLWPLAAVIVFTMVLALQIPCKALIFRPRTVEVTAEPAFVSFVDFDAKTYAEVIQTVRMSWQMRSQGGGTGMEKPPVVLDAVKEELSQPEPLQLPATFSAVRGHFASDGAKARVSLRPPSLAMERTQAKTPPPAPDEAEEHRRLREQLLALPPSLQQDE